MPNPRKKIILNEILFWKQNKLLPDHYCDFLMTLYTEGNELELEEEISHKKAIKAKERRNNNFLLVTISILTILLVLALFMTTSFVWLVVLFAGIVAVLFIVGAFTFAKKYELLAPILQIAAALIIFLLSVKVSIEYFPNNLILLFSLLIANCVMWLLTGLKLKLLYFTISGSLGLVVLIVYQFLF